MRCERPVIGRSTFVDEKGPGHSCPDAASAKKARAFAIIQPGLQRAGIAADQCRSTPRTM